MRAELNAAGDALQRWLDAASASQEWLVDQLNQRRVSAAILQRVQRSNLWRWMTGRQRINIDDATLIQQITEGVVPAILWSVHYGSGHDRLPSHLTDKKTKGQPAPDRTRRSSPTEETPASSRRPGAKKKAIPAKPRRTPAKKAA